MSQIFKARLHVLSKSPCIYFLCPFKMGLNADLVQKAKESNVPLTKTIMLMISVNEPLLSRSFPFVFPFQHINYWLASKFNPSNFKAPAVESHRSNMALLVLHWVPLTTRSVTTCRFPLHQNHWYLERRPSKRKKKSARFCCVRGR